MLPVYVRGKKTICDAAETSRPLLALRFPPPFFATQKATVEAAATEAPARAHQAFV